MARVLVLGASGYVGSHLIPRLVERGHEVPGCRTPAGGLWLPAGGRASRRFALTLSIRSLWLGHSKGSKRSIT